MSSAARREREREELRRAILDAARELLLADGEPEKLSMRRIADKIDYSATALYLHFKDKGELMSALAAEGFTLLADALGAVQADDPAERLRLMGHAYVEFALANRPSYRLMFQLGDDPQSLYESHTTHRAASSRALGLLVETVREVGGTQWPEDPNAAEGPDAATFAAGVLWAHIHGAVSLVLTGRGRIFADVRLQFCRQAVETAVAGLLSELSHSH